MLAGVLTSCSGSEGPPEPNLSSIELSPASATLQVAATQQFTATGHFSDGSSAAVTVSWTATGGTVSASGLFTAGPVPGTFEVVATGQGGSVSGAAAVTVTAAPPVLTSVTVSPATVSLAPTAKQQFTATGHYSGGGTGSVTVNWTATGGTINSSGLYTAGPADGAYQVTATEVGSAISGNAGVTITTPPPNLVAIEVSPSGVRILPFITQQYAAVGRLNDNTTVPVAVVWSVTYSTLTTVHNTISPGGLFQAGNVLGSFTVTATEAGGTLSGSMPVSVHSTTGLTVAPPSFSFWAPQAGKVYLCTSNHFTDDPVGLGGTAVTVASPAGGVTAPNVSYTNLGPHIYPDGSGEVQVVCQEVWSAPAPPNDVATVTITVTENPGSGMAKVFEYTNPCLTADCRAGYTDQQTFEPNWTTAAVSASVTVSATAGANIWFKNTLVP
ncbi:MAG: hypothetical protein H6Q77_2098 [Gemmatimonadetes bacterium]|nr:hypothetical protein [Gemmatimonadota bacterium]